MHYPRDIAKGFLVGADIVEIAHGLPDAVCLQPELPDGGGDLLVTLHCQDMMVRQGSKSHTGLALIPSCSNRSPNQFLKSRFQFLLAQQETVFIALA